MKKQGILNSEIAKVLADMGHTDTVCIADAGLPVPDGGLKIDIALTLGKPAFIDTLKAVLEDMEVEKVIIAEEIKESNASVFCDLVRIFGNTQTVYVPHEKFKNMTSDCKAIIRTGENTPYANIILQSGCIF